MSSMVGTVRIRGSCVGLLRDNLGRISVLFAATLQEQTKQENGDELDEDNNKEVVFEVHIQVPPGERTLSEDLTARLQKYVDDICGEGCAGAATQGEDSSYDSDCEAEPPTKHQDVSRTTSDTLAAEYAEYVQTTPDSIPGYTARVEFALKLGYTERLVQAALQKLGPAPAQNELLAELIKLGAQKGGGASCDSSPTESPLDGVDVLGSVLEHHQLHHHLSGGNYQNALRPIVIDGSNVAMGHGNKEVFSCRGIKICVDWFKARGHREITVFVPKWRKEAPRPDNPVQDQEILTELEKERLLVFTPSRLVAGKRTVCYDDRYILRLAIENEGIVVSNDNYRDLCQESAEYRRVVEERLLMYSFVNDRFMPPEDPLGRTGPTLDNFLRYQTKKGTAAGGGPGTGGAGGGGGGGGQGADGAPPPPPCPYGKKCTYGNKCKYHHPERGPFPHKSVTERLSEHAQRHLQAREGDIRKTPLGRTRSNVPPPKETPQHAIVSKSRSVDNVGTTYQTPPPPPLENLHRKLQRQLTLNPGSDPRLINQQQRATRQQQQQQHYAAGPPPSLPQGYAPGPPQTSWEMHQHVTRIASAPDSYRPWPPGSATAAGLAASQQHQQQQHQHHRHMQRISSCSDPQLNVWPPMWSQGLGGGGAPPPLNLQEDARRKLHYHLAAIFPEEQVTQAMQMFPDETNPQKICAAILSMFPKT